MVLTKIFRNILLETFLPKFQLSTRPKISDKSSGLKGKKSGDTHKNDNGPPEPQRIFPDDPKTKRKNQLRKCKIVLREPESSHLISGVPLELTCFRVVRIYQPRKNAMQSGTRHIGHWEIDFGTKARWENPLMGWCSTGDANSNVKMTFSTKEEATEYCKKNNMIYWVQESKTSKKHKIRSYASNFHHKNRTRVSTK